MATFAGVRHFMHPEKPREHRGEEGHSHQTLCGKVATGWPERNDADATMCQDCLAVAHKEHPVNVNGRGTVSMGPDGDLAVFGSEGFSAAELEEKLTGVTSPAEAFEALGMEMPDIEYTHDEETRMATTTELLEIVAEAKRMNLNRRLDKYTWDYRTFTDETGDLAADKWHMLVPVLVHRYAQEQPCEPHMRVTAHLYMKDTIVSRPEKRVLDIPMPLWKRLRTTRSMETPDILAAREDTKQWSRDTAMARRRIGRKGPV